MPALATNHPAPDRLADFGLGRLNDDESRPIEEHLTDCDECRRRVEELPADALVSLLQSPGPTSSHAHSARPTTDDKAKSGFGLFQRLKGVLAEPGAHPSPTPQPQPSRAAGVWAAGFAVPKELEGHSRYHVLAPLGAGGMGAVYKAQHRLMERTVALKIVNPLLINKPGAVERFTREIKAAAQLVHPNIVTAYDAEKIGDLHVLVMEYVEGETLDEVLLARNELPVDKACDYIRQAALGLQHALDRGMVHRDIKPHNLMLQASPDGSSPRLIKILDFGLARFVSEQGPPGASTEHGALMGSPDYMAPEHGRDAHSADERADIYSLGCTLYQLLVGQVPFPASSLLEKLEAHRDKQPLPLQRLRSDVPAELNAIVAKMLAKNPADRFQTPAEVAAALEPFTKPRLTSHPVPAPRPVASIPRKPLLALAVVLLLAFIGSLAAPFVIHVMTPTGTLIVETEDPTVEVRVKSGGKEVDVFFPSKERTVPLKVGEYTLDLVKGIEGLELSTDRFKIRDNQHKVVVKFIPFAGQGTLFIKSVDPSAEVVVKSSSGDVTQLFPKSGRELKLKPGNYGIELARTKPGLVLSAKTIELKNGDIKTVAVQFADERLNGREVLTVTQDGIGAYSTIQAALNAVQENQVILVMGRGPYREKPAAKMPANVALVSLDHSRVEIDAYEKDDRNQYWSAWFVADTTFHMSGLHWIAVSEPSDSYMYLLNLWSPDIIVEKCVFIGTFAGHAVALICRDQTDKHSKLTLRENYFSGRIVAAYKNGNTLIERNLFARSPIRSEVTLHQSGQVSFRHNIVQHHEGPLFRIAQDREAHPGVDAFVHNNVFDVDACPLSFEFAPDEQSWVLPRSVSVGNNVIRSRNGQGIYILAHQLEKVRDRWRVGPNCYWGKPVRGPLWGSNTIGEVWPWTASDLVLNEHFLTLDSNDVNFLRIASDGPLARNGSGGDLPNYFGAFPPGPAPKEGDWFTRLQERAKTLPSRP